MVMIDTDSLLPDFTYWFTSLVVEWNLAERTAQGILCDVLGGSKASYAVSCEVMNVQLTNALRASGCDLKPETRDAVVRFCDVFERLREYRNFVVHGAQEMPDENSQRGLGVAVLGVQMAKGSLKIGSQAVNADDLRAVSENITQCREFAEAIRKHLVLGEPPPSLETLHVPKRLSKNIRSHPLLSLQPQSSPR